MPRPVVDRVGTSQGDHAAFGAPANRAADVRERRGARTAGQDEFLQRRQIGVVMRQQGVQPGNLRLADQCVARNAQFAAQIEQLMLDGKQLRPQVRRQRLAQQQAQMGVQFIHIAHGLDAGMILGHTAAVAEPGAAVIACACCYFGKPMPHVSL